jgi:hypothetical protein
MVQGVPADVYLTCQRCHYRRLFVNVDGGTVFRCSGCEWYWTLSTQAPTGTDTATLLVGGLALTVASGGASFTAGMLILFDTLVNAEVLTAAAGATGVNIPLAAPGAMKAHLANATFGQLLMTPTNSGFDMNAVPNNPGWGF